MAFSSKRANTLPLVSREWKNGSNSSYNCTPFLHSLLTKGKIPDKRVWWFWVIRALFSALACVSTLQAKDQTHHSVLIKP